MGSAIGNDGEMKRSRRQFDIQLDRLLAGEEVPDIGSGLTELVTRIQSETERGDPDIGLASALAVEASHAEGAPARTRFRAVKPLPIRWRRRIMLSTLLSSLFAKFAAGAVALATTTGGLAATGNLPDPVQDWTAERLGAIGIEVPYAETQSEDTAEDVLDVIQAGDPQDGDEFGKDVAGTASDGKSSDGLDTAGEGADNGDEGADTADEHTDEVPDAAEDGADNADAYRP